MSLSSRDIRLLADPIDFAGRRTFHLQANNRSSSDAADQNGRFPRRSRTVGEIMSLDVHSISPDATLNQLAHLMQHSGSVCVVIVESECLVGIVTQRDMIKILAQVLDDPQLLSRTIRPYMSKPVHLLSEAASLHEAQRLFSTQGFSQVPVVNLSGRLVGMLSRERLAEVQMSVLEEERRAIERQVDTRSRELQKVNRELKALALEDSLLKIGNRRALELDAQSMHMNAVRHQHPYSLALLDVDYFKRYNDRYGHCAGDHALITIVECLQDSIRRGDRLYRYGGEELLLMMPETPQAEAIEAVWRVIKNLHHLDVEHSTSPYGRLTISGGVSTYTGNDTSISWPDILEQADKHLYQAKALGRNCVYGVSDENCLPHSHHS